MLHQVHTQFDREVAAATLGTHLRRRCCKCDGTVVLLGATRDRWRYCFECLQCRFRFSRSRRNTTQLWRYGLKIFQAAFDCDVIVYIRRQTDVSTKDASEADASYQHFLVRHGPQHDKAVPFERRGESHHLRPSPLSPPPSSRLPKRRDHPRHYVRHYQMARWLLLPYPQNHRASGSYTVRSIAVHGPSQKQNSHRRTNLAIF